MNRTKILLSFLLLATVISCNQGEQKKEQEQQVMKFAAALAPQKIIDSVVITPAPSFDTITYFHTVEVGTYTYNQPGVEVKLKGTTTPVNRAPVASAGPDQSLTLPANRATLNATGSTDPDNNIASYGWRKVSGPFSNIVNQDQPVATITDLVAGVYVYEVRVLDAGGLFSVDLVTITVNGPVDPQPGTTRRFTGSIIPYSDVDLVAPGRGAEQWHDRTDVRVPSETAPAVPLDVYYRTTWNRFEGATEGSWNFSWLKARLDEAIARGQKLSFGIMSVYTGVDGNTGGVQINGTWSAIPAYLVNKMNTESPRAFTAGGSWIPNWNSPYYLARCLALNQAINNFLTTTRSAGGILYKDVVQFIDIRLYGNWGEWHSAGIVPDGGNINNVYPAGTFPTVASLKKIVDAHTQGFPNFQLVCMIAAFDAHWLTSNTNNPPEIADYILRTARNNVGPIGWRRDQWGATDNYLKDYLENNNRSFGNSGPFKTYIMDRWKTSPITGEPPAWNPGDYYDLERQIRLYHATSFGNGNYGVTPNTTIKDRVRAASKASGYRLQIDSGFVTSGTNGKVVLYWSNIGLAPTYENWNTVVELKSGSSVVWTGTSSFKARLFLPTTAPVKVEDSFANIPAGNYTLTVKLVDPSGYRKPIVLANRNRNADGSYTLIQ